MLGVEGLHAGYGRIEALSGIDLEVRPGEIMSLVGAKPRPVTVKAVDNVETLFVPRSAFMKLANQAPDLAQRAADRIRRELTGYLSAVEQVKGKIGSSKG